MVPLLMRERAASNSASLTREGNRLLFSMLKEVDGDNFRKQVREQLGDEKGAAWLKSLPHFSGEL